jgi:apolipoprotein D and lipocalin family protein
MKKLLSALFLLFGCAGNYPELPVVEHVDLSRYIGKWYEIASFPQSFQKGCNCSTAEYFLTDEGYIRVLNSCRKGSVDGELKTAEGKAWIEDEKTNAKLSVQFFWPFKGDYWIIELAEDYSWAVVGHPNREYLWILSRTPKMESAQYNTILDKVRKKGFDISKLNLTIQECN